LACFYSINNVGVFNEYPERFEKTEGGIKKLTDMALVNMLPQTILSHYILRQMVPRKKGIIVNISSTINYFEWYYLAVYSASKRYARWLSATLQAEYKGSGITIQTVCPSVVSTNMTKNPKPSFTEPTPVKFVGQAIHSIGLIKETTGCFAHQLNVTALKQLLNLNQPFTQSLAVEPTWKLLIFDGYGQDIISPLLNVKQLREAGVTLHMHLNSQRETLPDVPAVYFVSPTESNIQIICNDLRKS
uniref:Uncharacterized protein n=1 Tax=Meloidogyne floridensis TaxID=298350 RepID=A0A915NS63_9BILA